MILPGVRLGVVNGDRILKESFQPSPTTSPVPSFLSAPIRQARNACVQIRCEEELREIEDTDQVEKEDRLTRVIT